MPLQLQTALGEVDAKRCTVTDASILVFVPACVVSNILIIKHSRDDTRISYCFLRTCTCLQAKNPSKINTNSEKNNNRKRMSVHIGFTKNRNGSRQLHRHIKVS